MGLIYLSPTVYKMSEHTAAGWDMMTQRHHGSPHNVVYIKTLAPRNLPYSKPQESLLGRSEQQRTNLRCSPAVLLSLMGYRTQKQHSGSTGAFMLLRGFCYLVWQLQRSAGGELRPDAVCVCFAGIVEGCRECKVWSHRWEALESWGWTFSVLWGSECILNLMRAFISENKCLF